MSDFENRRILIVDDNESIHADFEKLLGTRAAIPADSRLDALAGDLFGDGGGVGPRPTAPLDFELSHALQGREGFERVVDSRAQGAPFALAFVDVRMPPGWDGIATTERMIEADPELVVVLCTAFSDYSWTEVVERLGAPERYLILKKPFDGIEVQQLASTLTTKWRLQRENSAQVEEIRSYAASLETVNRTLAADKRLAETRAQEQARFLTGAGRAFGRAAGRLCGDLDRVARAAEEAARAQALEAALRHGHGLAAGLAELCELSAIEAGDHRPEPAATETAPLLAELRRRAVASFAERGLPLVTGDGPNVPGTVELDRERVLLALDALAGWAAGRADERGARLDCRTRRSEVLDTLELEFELTFHGAPIDAAEREALFRPFQGADAGREDEDGAVRELALPLARRLSERLGGTFRLEAGRDGACTLLLRLDPGPVDAGELRPVSWGGSEGRSTAA